MKYQHYILKRKIENIFIFPFIIIGRLTAILKPLKKEYQVFFFFPFYHTGGAEKVHALITQATGNKNCIIYFTRKSSDTTFKNDFEASGCVIKDISAFTDNKWLYFFNLIYRGIITGYINTQIIKPVVFNGQCNFAYKISPWIKKPVKQIELIHAFNTFSWIRIPFIKFYFINLTVSEQVIKKHELEYKKIEPHIFLFSNFYFQETKIKLPDIDKVLNKNFNSTTKVLFCGRGTSDKRPELAAKVSELISHMKLETKIEFHFAGDVINSIPKKLHKYCIFHGDITDMVLLEKLYSDSHILIVTSSTESGPLVILEGMSHGLVIVTTDVGFAPNYINNNINGLKLSTSLSDNDLTSEMSHFIYLLANNTNKLKEMSKINIDISFQNFGIEVFYKYYKDLFDSLLN